MEAFWRDERLLSLSVVHRIPCLPVIMKAGTVLVLIRSFAFGREHRRSRNPGLIVVYVVSLQE